MPDVRRYQKFVRQRVDTLDDVLRSQLFAIFTDGIRRFKFVQPFQPIARRKRLCAQNEFLQRVFRVAHDGNVHGHVARDGRGVGIDMHYDRVLCEILPVSGHSVVETRSYRKQQVALVHRRIRAKRAVYAHVAEVQRMLGIYRALAHYRRYHGYTRQFGKSGQLIFRARHAHAAARQQQWPSSAGKRGECSLYLPHVYVRRRSVSAYLHRFGILFVARLTLNVFRYIHQHRTRSAAAGYDESFFYCRREARSVADGHRVFGDTAHHTDYIGLLKSVVAYQMPGHLTRKTHERNAVVIRRGDRRHEIGRARSAGDQANARTPRGAGITIRRVRQPLFVTRKYDVNAVCGIKRVEQIDGLSARVREQHVHVLRFQRLHEQFGTRYHVDIPPVKASTVLAM